MFYNSRFTGSRLANFSSLLFLIRKTPNIFANSNLVMHTQSKVELRVLARLDFD